MTIYMACLTACTCLHGYAPPHTCLASALRSCSARDREHLATGVSWLRAQHYKNGITRLRATAHHAPAAPPPHHPTGTSSNRSDIILSMNGYSSEQRHSPHAHGSGDAAAMKMTVHAGSGIWYRAVRGIACDIDSVDDVYRRGRLRRGVFPTPPVPRCP